MVIVCCDVICCDAVSTLADILLVFRDNFSCAAFVGDNFEYFVAFFMRFAYDAVTDELPVKLWICG